MEKQMTRFKATTDNSRKKVCTRCGRKLWLRDFYKYRSTGKVLSWCKECFSENHRQWYLKVSKVPDGIFMNRKQGRVVVKDGKKVSIHWNANMLSMLHRYYPNTKNTEVAELLGVSVRTLNRKVKALGLKKDADYIENAKRDAGYISLASRKKTYSSPGSPK